MNQRGPSSSRYPLQHLLLKVPTAQTHPYPGARATFASDPLHPHSLIVTPRSVSPPSPGPVGAASLWLARAGAASRDSLCATASGPSAFRTQGMWRPLSLPFVGWGSTLWFFSLLLPSPLPPAMKPKEYHRESWGRVAWPSWWVWWEVGEELGGGAERLFPQVQRGDTIEREGQRVMAVRGRSERLLSATLLEASWAVNGVREGVSGRSTSSGSRKGFVCGLPYIGILEFWILL